MAWIVMKKVGTKLASEKLSQVREGGAGAEGRRKEGMEVRVVPTTTKKNSYWLNFFSARVFFFERD